jgi:hypothetical protein
MLAERETLMNYIARSRLKSGMFICRIFSLQNLIVAGK